MFLHVLIFMYESIKCTNLHYEYNYENSVVLPTSEKLRYAVFIIRVLAENDALLCTYRA